MAPAPRYGSRELSKRMREAGEQLALDFKKATSYPHPGARGTRREDSVRTFLKEQLPAGYGIESGFVFDARDSQSRQLDVLIYRVRDTPFVLAGDPLLVPCESLLAVIEVKSELNAGTLREAFTNAKSVRQLKPFDKSFADVRMKGEPANDLPRCLYSVFAFATDLAEGDHWLLREGERITRTASGLGIPPYYIDRFVVLDRGIINSAEGRGHDCIRSGQSALQIWFVHLMNHLLREDRRRKEIDIDIYTGAGRWMVLPTWLKGRAENRPKATVKTSPATSRSPGFRKRVRQRGKRT